MGRGLHDAQDGPLTHDGLEVIGTMVRKGDLDITNARPVIEGLERRLLMSGAWNVALIDSTLADSDLLVRSVDGADCVAVYDGSADSAVDILFGLAEQANSAGAQIASLAILSHGSAGQFDLGDESISSSSLGLTAAAWTELGEVMEDGGNISIYGCNVADGSAAGQALLDRLAALTGTYVFASDDLTGAGGDWDLEAASSGAEAELAAGALVPLDLAALSDYSWSLADPVANDDEYDVNEESTLSVSAAQGLTGQ